MMLFAALALVLPSAADGEHSVLHPADAEFYLEVPDVQALITAYSDTALARFMRDEVVVKMTDSLGDSLGEVDLDLAAAVDGMMESEGFLASVRSLSFSVVVGEAPPQSSGVGMIAEFTDAAQATLLSEKLVDFVEEGANEKAWHQVQGQRLLIGAGRMQPETFPVREGGGVASSEKYRHGLEYMRSEGGVVVVRGFHTLSPLALAKQFAPNVPTGILESIPGDPLAGPMHWQMRLVGDRFLSEAYTPNSGGLSFLGRAPIESDWLEPVPDDVMLLYSTALHGEAVADELCTFFEANAPEGCDLESLQELQPLFSRLGPGMVAYAFPVKGLGLPAAYAWVDVIDPAGFHAELEGALARAAEFAPGLSWRTRDYRVKDGATGDRIKVPITAVSLPPELMQGSPVSIKPSYAIVNGKLLLSITEMNLKRELKRIYAERGDPYAQTAARSPLKSRGLSLPDDARSVLVFDWGILVDGLLGIARTFLGFADGMADGELGFDPELIPDGSVFQKYVRPTFHYSMRVKGGLYIYHESSIGPELFVGPALLIGSRANSGPTTIAPSTQATHEEAFEAGNATEDRIANLKNGLAVYQLTLGEYPEGLPSLIEPTGEFPHGFLESTELPLDEWGREFFYERDAEGYRLWSGGPNRVDEYGAGDDISGP